jgi:glycolate oxidase
MLREQLILGLQAILPTESVLYGDEDLRPYECDGLSAYKQLPRVVVLPHTEAQIIQVLQLCHATQTPVVARGAGTGLSGGALPHTAGVLLSLTKLNQIRSIDPLARLAYVQPGVKILVISEAAKLMVGIMHQILLHKLRTLGGNVAKILAGALFEVWFDCA